MIGDLLLFDIDGTIFDSSRFGELYRAELITRLNISEDTIFTATADYYSTLESRTDFEPKTFISFLASRFSVQEARIAEIFWNKEHFESAVFEDAISTLEALSKNKTLGVFSQGHTDYQKYKLEQTALHKYFKPEYIFIYARKLSDEAIALLPRDATVIDNKHDVALALSKFANVIWINRNNEEKDPQIKTIHTLSELL